MSTLMIGLFLAWACAAGLAAWKVRRLGLALAVGVALRLALLVMEPTLSDDLWRYLWEGRVQLAGLDPFLHAPSDPALEGLRNATWERVGHKDVSTIYPPLALWLFRGVAFASETALAWKLLVTACDIALMFVLVRACRERGVGDWAPALYALHPLPVLESAGSGHLESIALLFLVLGIWRKSSFLVGLGALVKVLPAVAWIAQRRILGVLATAVLALALTLPFIDAGATLLRGFETYARHWSFNAALFPLLEALFGERARLVGVGIGALWCLVGALRLRDPAALVLHVAVGLIFLSPVVHPWYVLWIFVPALLRGAWPWAVLASTTLLSYMVLVGYDPSVPGSWEEPAWVVWIEYPPALAVLLWWTLRKRRSRASAEA